jgi:pyruvate/2-oxoglutarate dehydrogenase complex dihydrolipoamide acyltransferase (E2) component
MSDEVLKVLDVPDVGEGVTEVRIVELLVTPGDAVQRLQPLLVVDSDKAEVEISSPWPGTVSRVFVEADAYVDVGSPLLEITTTDG